MRRSRRQTEQQKSAGALSIVSTGRKCPPETDTERSLTPPSRDSSTATRKRRASARVLVVPRPQGDAASNSEYDDDGDGDSDDLDDYNNGKEELGQASDQEPARKKHKTIPVYQSDKPRAQKKTNKNENLLVFQRLFGENPPMASGTLPCQLPQRAHSANYHRPLLLDSREGRAGLLAWFDSVSSRRSMPWRKPWIDQRKADGQSVQGRREAMERRAYEVWISEIMLQQTRVAVVIGYWSRWMEAWPTIQDLAAATPDDVLAAWRGLGYYSRATRIHDAAKLVCGDPAMGGLLPSAVDELVANVPGVGRYTAGAISAIVFGKAAPMVDGNVLRVLSRQLGVLGNVKTDKAVIDLLWAAADSLVKAVAGDVAEGEDDKEDGAGAGERVSDRPGRWGQALMELGSTVCTPKPDCAACPITATCRAYGEGLQLASPTSKKKHANVVDGNPIPDIEDSCAFCMPFEEVSPTNGGDDDNDEDDDDDTTPASKKKQKKPLKGKASKTSTQKQATLSSFFTQPKKKSESESAETTKQPPPSAELTLAAVDHARKFPVKIVKKAVREQETLVCAVRRSDDGRYLIRRRPAKGLLAGLWEFPSLELSDEAKKTATTAAGHRSRAELYTAETLGILPSSSRSQPKKLVCVGSLGSVPWLFSHLRLTMHVFLFELRCSSADEFDVWTGDNVRWSACVEDESMGTGMRKCWELVHAAEDE